MTAAPPVIDHRIFDANIAATAAIQPRAAASIRAARPPAGAEAATARDGSPTFMWQSNGCVTWLGRTQMPRIRAEALVEGFAPGEANAAMVGAGSGAEIVGLLDKLPPTQGLFVIETEPAALAMILRLHDLTRPITRGRLFLFAGTEAWDEMATFLRENDGCLSPDRVLNWPWFSPAESAAIAERLRILTGEIDAARRVAWENLMAGGDAAAVVTSQMGAVVTAVAKRESGTTASSRRRPVDGNTVRIAIIATDGRDSDASLAGALRRAAESLAWTHVTFVADRPMRRHPLALARALAGIAAQRIVLIGTTRAELGRQIREETPVTVWWPDAEAVWSKLVKQIGGNDRLVLPRQSALDAAVAAGLAAARVRRVPPGGDPLGPIADAPSPIPFDADAVGLNLASHQALWVNMTECLRGRFVPWSEARADELLARAESETAIRLSSAEVRAGLIERIRQSLGPGVEREACLGVWRRHFPQAWRLSEGESAPASSNERGGALLLPREGLIDAAMLTAAARGMVLFVRAHPAQRGPEGWARFLDPARHAVTFSDPADLNRKLDQFRSDPSPFGVLAQAACAHVLAEHAWSRRLCEAIAE